MLRHADSRHEAVWTAWEQRRLWSPHSPLTSSEMLTAHSLKS
ncbi:hypothetical protein C4K34_3396 [Pseudomonas chlororaphis subsp. piscium]|nr:hypothetical protein C4K34_3396 [Pseudomonas chlororaphis subsp. piscium]AZC76266.1 hypothetical protein C4K31_3363 [Pseudomonas chlororaphis subsp. piscium]AZC89689.1 hypothetical protein C4K29_3388 [Pseudomonas chlororaphis subsp. piscium]AZC96076.1 hypothetical protein C4K28_3348 [Pseudomonas chlororaphis subsp. piscium]